MNGNIRRERCSIFPSLTPSVQVNNKSCQQSPQPVLLNSPLMAPHYLFLWPLLPSELDHRLGGLALQKASVKIYLCVLQKDPKIQGACGMLSAVSIVTGIFFFFQFCKYHFCLSLSFLNFLFIYFNLEDNYLTVLDGFCHTST